LSRTVPVCPKGEMVRDAGFEPATPLLTIRHLRKTAHPRCSPAIGTSLWGEVSEVVAAWLHLAEPLRTAVLAIVRSTGRKPYAIGRSASLVRSIFGRSAKALVPDSNLQTLSPAPHLVMREPAFRLLVLSVPPDRRRMFRL
jgi:hypothetical protein